MVGERRAATQCGKESGDRDDDERGADAEEQAVEGALGLGLGDQGGGGLADADLVGILGIGGGGQECIYRGDVVQLPAAQSRADEGQSSRFVAATSLEFG